MTADYLQLQHEVISYFWCEAGSCAPLGLSFPPATFTTESSKAYMNLMMEMRLPRQRFDLRRILDVGVLHAIGNFDVGAVEKPPVDALASVAGRVSSFGV